MHTSIHGHADPRFEPLVDAMAEEIDSGEELGASIAIDVDGQSVLDIWGGHADAARTVPWREDTIVNLWSTTKNVTNMAALVLVDRGKLDLDAPVARYWPEFAANGKEQVLVRHVLSHTSGVAGWEPPFTVADAYDWQKATSALASQAPWWEPGTQSGYHAQNLGHLVGELVRRTDGRSLRDFVREEIATALDADFQIGARASDDDRIAEVIEPPPVELPVDELGPDHPMAKAFGTPLVQATDANTIAWRRADMGAVNGHGNARSLVRMLSPISLGGTANGVQLLSPATIDRIFDVQADGPDLVLGLPVRWGIGYGLPKPESLPFIPDEKLCFWPGWGGSIALMNLDRRMTLGYAMNRMGAGVLGSERTARYVTLALQALG
jgi:CubicO group peptidase (beta-lactamase class C family)